MSQLEGKTIFITGASRGIGKAIGLKAAASGANIVIAAKTISEHPSLPGTIYTAAEEMEKAGGKALPVQLDVRSEESVEAAVRAAVDKFGSVDILINNASAIQLTKTDMTQMKRFDLMHQVNVRGTFMTTQKCLPWLSKGKNPHILNISPPLNLSQKWFKGHVAYTMSKYGMSMCVLGWAEEFRSKGIAANALWPYTIIATAALQVVDKNLEKHARTPEIMAEAACQIISEDSSACTGQFFIDEWYLREKGVKDFSQYTLDPDQALQKDYFLD